MSIVNSVNLAAATMALLAPAGLQAKGSNPYRVICRAQSCSIQSPAINFKLESNAGTIILKPVSFASTKGSTKRRSTLVIINEIGIVPDFIKVGHGRFLINQKEIVEERWGQDAVSTGVTTESFIQKLKGATYFRASISYPTDVDVIMSDSRQLSTAPFVRAISQALTALRPKGAR